MAGMASTLEEVLARTDRLSEAFRAARVQLAFLFGSVLDGGSPGQARDLDIAVSFERYDFAVYLGLKERLHVILLVPEERLDLVVLDRCGPSLRLRAALAGSPLYVAEPRVLDDFLQEALFEYEDFQHFRRQFRPRFEQRLGEGLSMAERKMDGRRVEAYLSQLDEAVGRLAELRRRVPSYDDFQADRDARELIVHHLRIALECVLDTCRHFLAAKGVSLAQLDTTNLIELAGEKGLLEPSYALSIKGMAGMRNAIVHVYWRLDLAAVYESVSRRLEQFDEFARQVKRHLPPLTEE